MASSAPSRISIDIGTPSCEAFDLRSANNSSVKRKWIALENSFLRDIDASMSAGVIPIFSSGIVPERSVASGTGLQNAELQAEIVEKLGVFPESFAEQRMGHAKGYRHGAQRLTAE